MSSSDTLQMGHTETTLAGVPWKARLRARCREFLLQSWALRQIHKSVYSHEGALQLAAMVDGAEYAAEHMCGAYASSDKDEILFRGVDQAPHDGLFLELGVWGARTINLTAERVNATVHGFDTFEVAPKEWHAGYSRDRSYNGRRPTVRPNVQLHVGRFTDTLPGFLAANQEPIAFMHVNCHPCTSTKTVLQYLAPRLRVGSVIVFNRYFNHAGWRNHDYRMFQELVQERSLSYRYLAYCTVEMNVAVQITRT